MCTFCSLAGDGDDEREKPLHIFAQCTYVENIMENFVRVVLDNNDDNEIFCRQYYFVFPRYTNPSKNVAFFTILNLFKFYIWDCKLRKIIPTLESAKYFVSLEVDNAISTSGYFRNIIATSGLHLNNGNF